MNDHSHAKALLFLAGLILSTAAAGDHPFRWQQALTGEYSGWPEQTAVNGPEFGYSVAISGDWMAVGAPGTITNESAGSTHGDGAVFMFKKQDGEWVLIQRFMAGIDSVPNRRCGHSVALTGPYLAFGCPGKGATWFYQRNGDDQWEWINWTGSTAGSQCGIDVSIARTPLEPEQPFVAATGCPGDSNGMGEVRIYKYDGNDSFGVAMVSSSDGTEGDSFGTSVALNSICDEALPEGCILRLVVGAPHKNHGSAIHGGSVYVFDEDRNETDIFTLPQPDFLAYAFFGAAVDINETELLVGVPGGQTSLACGDLPRCGQVRHWEHSGSSWTFKSSGGAINSGGDPAGEQLGMRFGNTVALGFDNWIAVGAPYTDGSAGNNVGLVELRRNDNGDWGVGTNDSRGEIRTANPRPGQVFANGLFGHSLAFGDDNWLAIGFPRWGTTEGQQGAVWMYAIPDGIFADRFEQ